MHDLLHGYGAATFESATTSDSLGRVAAELGTFVGALTSSESLRRVLSDGAVSLSTRRAIAADLLEERADPATEALVDFALRVVRPTELPLALAGLLEAAESHLAGIADSVTTGRSAIRDRVRGYTERVLEELSALDEVDQVEEELFSFARIVDTNPPLRHLLSDSTAPLVARREVLRDLLSARVQPATLRLATYVISAGAVRDLVGTYEWLVDLAAEERNRRVAQVRAAVDLSQDEREALARVLSTLMHREVEVRVIDDPTVIGGVLVSVGDLLVDGTVRLRFERLREAIAQWA